ncbi:hypothetical protein [Branchiibius sp. NY16-3462-2]|uniref:hypothetical protein n=1 Tax=Branchiibius sp. NY16-3462-2 TaxID=1807500 RepID=UPI0007911A76|nr:hypothetical protein [Branchiibius sp. NY16-3462-2]KYH44866.1 hypothetical protein AZH51_01680 [Branchiibius sp. NY16-3462-2]
MADQENTNNTAAAFTVNVTRHGTAWHGNIPQLDDASTHASTLPGLVDKLRDAAITAADLPADALVELDLEFDDGFPELVAAASVGKARRDHARNAEQIAARTNDAVHQLVQHGYSVRDVALVVGITAGRVSQITAASGARRTGR